MDASADRVVTGEPDDALSTREAWVGKIVAQVEHQGYYLVHLDPHPQQQVIDLRWAAQLVGRSLGRRMQSYVSTTGAKVPGKVTVIVVPVEARTASEVRRRATIRLMIQDLLDVHAVLRAAGRATA